ncbi:MAG: hypothetical protein PW786_03495 [Arachidicoccus sp.]|nr:hypothetical protein [Arachidicoccus sp.]
MIKYIFLYLLLFIMCIPNIHGQVPSSYQPGDVPIAKPAIPSSLGDKTNISANLYTGVANINIPLYNVSYKTLNIPISLEYISAQGIKPDVMPGIAGNGWDLPVGGYIQRIENSLDVSQLPTFLQPLPDVMNPTEEQDWASDEKMKSYWTNISLLYSNNGQYDIYSFNFLGLSGTFYTNYDGQVKIKSNNGEDLKIIKGKMSNDQTNTVFYNQVYNIFPAEDQGDQPFGSFTTTAVNDPTGRVTVTPPFVGDFTIIDSKGIKYVFGNDRNAVEFTREGMHYYENDINHTKILADKWFLTFVILPDGTSIDFTYKRDKFFVSNQMENSGNILISNGTNLNKDPTGLTISSVLTNPCYLDHITTPNEIVNFSWSEAKNQLGYNFNIPNPPNNPPISSGLYDVTLNNVQQLDYQTSTFYFCKYTDVGNALVTNRFPNKLDKINITTPDNKPFKQILFNYTNSTNTRLKLLSLSINDQNNNQIQQYQFTYNTTPLPSYLSMQTDHFGFYNGQSGLPFSTNPTDYQSFFASSLNRSSYYQSKEPNSNYAKAEILQKITLPTGGYKVFEYEGNTYSKHTQDWPNIVLNDNTNLNTCGLRVRSISSYDVDNNLIDKKSYFYNTNFINGSTVSSGILSHVPVYYEDYFGSLTDELNHVAQTRGLNYFNFDLNNTSWYHWSTNTINPLRYEQGSFICYS